MKINPVKILQEDQADRMNPRMSDNPNALSLRDKERRKLIAQFLAARKRLSSKELYAAAIVYHHGPAIVHSHLALRLARRSEAMGYARARWLVLGAEDRLLVKQGKPQKYGTQYFRKNTKYKWRLRPIDHRVTDAQRLTRGATTLAKAKAKLREMNAPFGNT